MNLLIFGAGASKATHRLPTTESALLSWARAIREEHRLLALALDWVASDRERQEANLEEVWTAIDVRSRVHLGYEWDDADRHDMTLLARRFGLELPRR